MILTRTTRHKLFETEKKSQELAFLFTEYSKCLNLFIDILWKQNTNKTFIDKKIYSSIPGTWLSSRLLQNCAKQALGIVKSAKTWNNKVIYKKWKRVYSYSKKHKRDWKIEEQTYTEYRKTHILRARILPKFDGNSMTLNANCCDLEVSNNSFDFWITMWCLGNKMKLVLPLKDYSYAQLYPKQGFTRKESYTITKSLENGDFYVNVVWEKTIPDEKKQEGKELGIDLGINKLISTSDGDFLGTELHKKIDELNNKVQGSKNHKRKIQEIKNYISQEVNKLDFTNIKLLVLEDLKHIQNRTKLDKKMWKKGRRLLSHWNRRLVLGRIEDKCEVNRVQLEYINPAYTSQKCSNCGAIHEESRKGENYHCVECGHQMDADTNGAKIILGTYLDRQNIVAYDTGSEEDNVSECLYVR
jgi:IS605 OrfB family transposase